MTTGTGLPQVLVLACGALARELQDVFGANRLGNVTLECLPASLHNTPAKIPGELRTRLARRAASFDRVMVGYADCGTAGEIDAVCAEFDAVRLPGAHCYDFYAGRANFAAMHDADPTAFYLTDYLVRHFDRIVIGGLGIDRHPQLLDAYFGNYRKVIYLSQVEDPNMVGAGQAAAARLGLSFEHHPSGYGELEEVVVEFAQHETQHETQHESRHQSTGAPA